jgi:cell division septation protein DedD
VILSELILPAALCLVLSVGQTGETRYREALRKIDAAEYDEAAVILKEAIRTLRGEALLDARFELARIDTDPVQAAFELQNLLMAMPNAKKPAIAIALGELRLLLGDPLSAASTFDAARRVAGNPAAEDASHLHALALFRAERHIEARDAWADHLVAFLEGRHQVAARLGIAAANERLGRTREAIEIYKAVLAQHPASDDEPWVLARLADLLRENEPQEARRHLERLRREYPLYTEESPPTGGIIAEPPSPIAAPATSPPRPASSSAPPPSVAQRPTVAPPPATTQRPAPSSPPAVTPTTARPPSAPSSGPVASAPQERFLIQAGVFREAANAERLRARLIEAGLPPHLARRGDLFVVSVGPFATEARAAEILPRVEAVLGETPRIVRRVD